MNKSKIIIKCLIVWAMIMLFFPTKSIAQSPTKQETIDWIKEKIGKYPGIWHMKFNDGHIDSAYSRIIDNNVTTTFTQDWHGKRLTFIYEFNLTDIVFNDVNSYGDISSGNIAFKMPAQKVKYITNTFNYEQGGVVSLYLYWEGEYDLYNRMKTALKALSGFNKPNEKY